MRIKKFLLLVIAICINFTMVGCVKSSWFSEKTHIKRVSKIIEEKYLEEGITYKLRPLYDNNDKLSYFVVDFSNDLYMYIKIWNETRFLKFANTRKMYTRATSRLTSDPWQRSKFVEENGKLIEIFEKDGNGNEIIYYNSHFEVANISEDTRCYLITVNAENGQINVPAIKQGDKYLNLITMEEFDENSTEALPESGIIFIVKAHFNL